tara:strand:- start:11535 stop:11924 length:390 start_codon:yes stop_codon:yes gene_type:complete
MISKEITEKINQLLNNGFSFGHHKTKRERNDFEQELLDYYNKSGFSAFIEEEMLYVTDLNHQQVLMIEITKNSIYFNPQEHVYLLDAVVSTLEFITRKFDLEEDSVTEENIENEVTEEMPKPKPNFDII